jgi:hypothetical protein
MAGCDLRLRPGDFPFGPELQNGALILYARR